VPVIGWEIIKREFLGNTTWTWPTSKRYL